MSPADETLDSIHVDLEPDGGVGFDAVIFGSLGTVTETSALHRKAFNEAFVAEGIDWHWSEEDYRSLLTITGGTERIRHFADSSGTEMTNDRAAAIHERKTARYVRLVDNEGVSLRPGVARLIDDARRHGLRVGFATGTSRENISANVGAVGGVLSLDDFDVIITREDIDRPKPAPDAHAVCCARLGVDPSRSVAIEDTADGVTAAAAAGSFVVATPGAFVGTQDFSHADVVVNVLGDEQHRMECLSGATALPADHIVTLEWLASLQSEPDDARAQV